MKIHEIITEVRLIEPNKPIESPLKDSDTIRVYHGTSDLDTAVIALTKGLSGDSKAMRKYSYEYNNNPKGLFVTPDLKTAKEFGDYILEIHTRVYDLESPVWPGGSFTVQGGMSGVFNDPEEREAERIKQREKYSQDENEHIRNSDRPELAASLFLMGERQALFTGDLNSNSIRAVWVSENPNRIGQQYKRLSPKEFLTKFKSEGIPTRYSGKVSKVDDKSEIVKSAEMKLVKPQEIVTVDKIVAELQKTYKTMYKDQIIGIMKQNPDYFRQYVWSDRQFDQLMKDLDKKNITEAIDADAAHGMKGFGISRDEIKNGYVTLYHGTVNPMTKLKKGEIFFMTPYKEKAKEYARIRSHETGKKGVVQTIKVNPNDVFWNTGSEEIEFTKGGEIKNGVLIPNEKPKKPSSDEEMVRYRGFFIHDVLPRSGREIKRIVNGQDNVVFFEVDVNGKDRLVPANSIIKYEKGQVD